MPTFDLIGVGSPIMDLLARVPDEFLTKNVAGEKGGMVLVDDIEMQRIVGLLDGEPAYATGGSAANATFNAARLGLRTTFLGKLGHDNLARVYRHAFETAGVDGSRFKHGTRANARCLALVTPDAQRTMRTYLGAAMTLSPAEISVISPAAATRTSKVIWCSIRRSPTRCSRPRARPAALPASTCRRSKW
jgi:sugar/nucleoside kinase (ribokinase family)